MKTVAIIGGGAAGFFAAITCAEKNPDYTVIILEKSPNLLSKVKISGGGRCNVTHACFDARQLTKNYPRGEKQLIGPFTRFNPTHTIEWFKQRGVQLKAEADGRMFPVTDSSQTIIDCFARAAYHAGVQIKLNEGAAALTSANGQWQITTTRQNTLIADAVIITTGSAAAAWKLLEQAGHTLVPAVPSLFTFNIKDTRIQGLEGISVNKAVVNIPAFGLYAEGPLLITHWGLSGPAVLRLSAWGARQLAAGNHRFDVEVNWVARRPEEALNALKNYKAAHPKQFPVANPQLGIPQRLWERFTLPFKQLRFADLSNKHLQELATALTATRFQVLGKSTYKDEFVTAGGVDLNEVDFKTMQSKKLPGIYFAGEVLDIDAITGGFNFQAAWTTGFIAGTSV